MARGFLAGLPLTGGTASLLVQIVDDAVSWSCAPARCLAGHLAEVDGDLALPAFGDLSIVGCATRKSGSITGMQRSH